MGRLKVSSEDIIHYVGKFDGVDANQINRYFGRMVNTQLRNLVKQGKLIRKRMVAYGSYYPAYHYFIALEPGREESRYENVQGRSNRSISEVCRESRVSEII